MDILELWLREAIDECDRVMKENKDMVWEAEEHRYFVAKGMKTAYLNVIEQLRKKINL